MGSWRDFFNVTIYNRAAVRVIVAIILVLVAPPAFAHHSFTAEFDGSRTITIQGVVSKVQWTNPHVYIFVDAKDSSGSVTNWSFETLPTGILHKMGLSKELMQGQTGEIVTVVANPAKDPGKALGWIVSLTYPGGRVYTLSQSRVGQ